MSDEANFLDAVQLSVFSFRINSICEEMGEVLRGASFSPNIKDRLDYSCALFDQKGMLLAQAAHIPVHLGSMAYAMKDVVLSIEWQPGDMVIFNSPYVGGTHLPDVTLVMPVYVDGQLCAFVANRDHHANIGCDTPGSMPVSRHIDDEGIIIAPTKICNNYELDEQALAEVLWQKRAEPDFDIHSVSSGAGDIYAQVSANRAGAERLLRMVSAMGLIGFICASEALNCYGERLARAMISEIPDGHYCFEDFMDSDGVDDRRISLQVHIEVAGEEVWLDFTKSADQVAGNINCPASVTAAAVYYVFRCFLPENAPACSGTFAPIHILTRSGSLLAAVYPAAVAAGNVETSSRVVDLVLGALVEALPKKIPAASQGTMNNVAMGGASTKGHWDYYETIAGGGGGNSKFPGLSGRHSHMTNTLNTPVESLEVHFPLRVIRYQMRSGSGGEGEHPGGEGVERAYELLESATVTLLTERRISSPWGLKGGEAGAIGVNRLNGSILGDKVQIYCHAGDVVEVLTPGGGGWGTK